MNRPNFSSPSSSSISNNHRQTSEMLIQADEFALINMLFSNDQNFLLAFLTFKSGQRRNAFFVVFSFLFGRKNMREATPIKETCNFTPAGLMTPRDAAVYIGVKINTLAVWRMTNRYGLPFIKLGKIVRYRKTDLDIWIENRLQNSSKD